VTATTATPSIRSSATELAGDLIDQNCDGRELCYTDVDRDGQRPPERARPR
jgi:hypothetical protein